MNHIFINCLLIISTLINFKYILYIIIETLILLFFIFFYLQKSTGLNKKEQELNQREGIVKLLENNRFKLKKIKI